MFFNSSRYRINFFLTFAAMKKCATFSIFTLGCKLNYSESSDIMRRLTENGLSISDSPDSIIVNSCAVTSSAEKKVRNLTSKLHREHPDSEIILVGCMGALKSETLLQWPGVSAVFGNRDKNKVIDYLLNKSISSDSAFQSAYSSNDRTRSFLKIQDGCDYYCSYCTVAKARGESRSDSISNVLENIDIIAELGIKEVNLTGVNIGDFGNKNESFLQLIQAIEAHKPEMRIRISSIEPNLLKDEIIRIVSDSKVIMPHFHIPLQSGSDRILSLMRRRYVRQLFADKIFLIKKLIPHACIAIDLISGFPGESDFDFEDSLNLINELPISYLHVFTYSKRPGTPASVMADQVPEPVKRDRTNRLLTVSDCKLRQFYSEHLATVRPVLFETDNKNGSMFGFTDNYIKVKVPYRRDWLNQIVMMELTAEIFCFD